MRPLRDQLHSSRPSLLPRRRRFSAVLGGVSFILAAIGWLIMNEQRRRLRIAVQRGATHLSPRWRRPVDGAWRWWRQIWVDPWGPYRDEVAGMAMGHVLEIGVGSWRNLRRYPPDATVVGVEANQRLVFAARRRARRLRPGAEVWRARAEELPFADAAFDTVVTNLALCSVADQAAALAEIARVLRPGGTLRFLEHVHAEQPLLAAAQTVLTPLWRLSVGGCHLNRDTRQAILDAGFTIHALTQVTGAWGPARPTLYGVALRPTIGPMPVSQAHSDEAR